MRATFPCCRSNNKEDITYEELGGTKFLHVIFIATHHSVQYLVANICSNIGRGSLYEHLDKTIVNKRTITMGGELL